MEEFNEVDKKILNNFQKKLPFVSNPYEFMANELGISQEQLLERLKQFKTADIISRVGAVFSHSKVGSSTLAALSVAPENLNQVAEYIGDLQAVNHHYVRQHKFNLWFVITADTEKNLYAIIHDIEAVTGLKVLNLPMEKAYCIDLGFNLWN